MENIPEKKCRTSDSRERILDTAVTLFARQGFARTGMRELAGTAEVNLAMINYFFGSKKKLLTEILDIFFSRYLNIAATELAGKGDLYARMEQFIISATVFFGSHKNFLLVAITELHHDDPEITEHKAAWARQMTGIMEQQFCSPLAKETGLEISPKLIAPLLTSMMASRFLFLPVMERVGTEKSDVVELETYARTIAGIFLRGIADQQR